MGRRGQVFGEASEQMYTQLYDQTRLEPKVPSIVRHSRHSDVLANRAGITVSDGSFGLKPA